MAWNKYRSHISLRIHLSKATKILAETIYRETVLGRKNVSMGLFSRKNILDSYHWHSVHSQMCNIVLSITKSVMKPSIAQSQKLYKRTHCFPLMTSDFKCPIYNKGVQVSTKDVRAMHIKSIALSYLPCLILLFWINSCCYDANYDFNM